LSRQLERFLVTPSLVRETSRYNPLQRVRAALGFGRPTPVVVDEALKAADKSFSDVILAPQVKHSIRALAASASNTRLHGAPFRHYLLFGTSLEFGVHVALALSI
jgi:ATPase family AAA domain-containing protein 3A/B